MRLVLNPALLVAAVAVIVGCNGSGQRSPTLEPAAEVPTVVSPQAEQYIPLQTSWARSYDDLRALKRDADVVIVGTVTSGAANADPSVGSSSTTPLIFTDFVVTVQDVLKGTASPATTVTIHQTGGTYGNITMEVGDDPLFQLGDQYVLFLREDTRSKGSFAVIGGPAGRFGVRSGRAVALSKLYPDRNISDLRATDAPIADFKTAISNAN